MSAGSSIAALSSQVDEALESAGRQDDATSSRERSAVSAKHDGMYFTVRVSQVVLHPWHRGGRRRLARSMCWQNAENTETVTTGLHVMNREMGIKK